MLGCMFSIIFAPPHRCGICALWHRNASHAQPSVVAFPQIGDLSSLRLLEDQKQRAKTEGGKYIDRVATTPAGIEGRFIQLQKMGM